jgi:hypothetical protein
VLPSKFRLTGLLLGSIIPDLSLFRDLRLHSRSAKVNFCVRLSGHDTLFRFHTQDLIFVRCLL